MDFSNAHRELERLVLSNISRIDLKRVKRIASKLQAENDEDLLNDEALLKEFVLTTRPSDVLLTCFYEYDLQNVAVDQLKIERERNLRGHELVDVILEECCEFATEIEPTGLYQIRECLDSDLKKAETDENLSDIEIDGICIKMAREGMEKVFPTLFLFHSWALWQKIPKSKDVIKELRERYRTGSKSLGPYIGFEDNKKKKKLGI